GGVGGPQVREPLHGPQGPQLGQGEVLGEPAGVLHPVDRLGGLACGELGVGGDVGGAGDVVLVPGHEYVVLGRDQVGLDVVRPHLDGQPVGGEGVLGPVAAGPAVADDQWDAAAAAPVDPLVGGGRPGHLG